MPFQLTSDFVICIFMVLYVFSFNPNLINRVRFFKKQKIITNFSLNKLKFNNLALAIVVDFFHHLKDGSR